MENVHLNQPGTGCWQMFLFFMRHSFKYIGRRKCNFGLAFCSIFTVVISTLVINTVISLGPIVFLQMAENKVGQYDAIFYPKDKSEKFFNYTKV